MIVYRELATIERELGFPLKTLYGISNNLDSHYRSVRIPKKSGKNRTLSVPDEILKKVQRAIVEKLLVFRPVSRYATAYKPSASVVRNAVKHVGKEKLLKLDILHFFDSVLYSTVKEKVFPAEIFSEKIRVLLSMLCYYKEVLPQGAPSSPMITNIILYDFDEAVGKWCCDQGITYTRYCDDMTFSGHFEEDDVIMYITDELQKRGFFLNHKKTALVPKGKQQKVTGIVVNQKLNVAREYKREIRKEVYFVEKFGVKEHVAHIASSLTPEGYLNRLLGKIGFVLSVCPDDASMQAMQKTILHQLQQLHTQA